MNYTGYDYSSYFERRKKKRLFRLLILICISTVLGLSSVVNYWRLMAGYSTASVEVSALRASDMFMSYMGFTLFLMISVVFGFLCRNKEKGIKGAGTAIVLFIALILANTSLPVLTALSTYVMMRYEPMSEMISAQDTAYLFEMAKLNPSHFYSFMVAVAIILVVAIVSIVQRVKETSNQKNK